MESPPPIPDDAWEMDEFRPTGGPLIVRFAGVSVYYVRTDAGDWIATDDKLVRGHFARFHPGVPLWTKSDKGAKPVPASALIEQHGTDGRDLVYDLTRDRSEIRVLPDGRADLLLACAPPPLVSPRWNEQVAEWLALLGGEQHDKLLDWLATVRDLTWPTAGLYLFGPKGAGKGMFAAGVARLFGRGVTSYGDITGSFNAALRSCPVVLLDEGCKPPEDGSASFRSLVGETSRPLTEKYRTAATLIGALRLIIAANNMDALRIRESLTAEDEAAIGERILFVDIPSINSEESDAGRFLADIGGRGHTIGWVTDPETGGPGAIPRHVAWLIENRRVVRGSRFAVAGEAGLWLRNAGRRGGLAQEVLVALARIADGATQGWDEDTKPMWLRPGEALVNPERLHRGWAQLTHNQRTPTLTTLGMALGVLASKESRLAGKAGVRPRVKHVPAEMIVDVADTLGIGDPDKIRIAFGLSVEP